VAAVSALDLLTEQAWYALQPIPEPCAIGAWTNALRGEVFTALYEAGPTQAVGEALYSLMEGPTVEDPARAAARWRSRTGNGRIVIVGDIGTPFDVVLRAAFGDGALLLERAPLAGVLLGAAARLAARDALSSPHAVRPLYVRRPDAVVARERTAAAGAAGRDGAS
jgi:tRNA A37 threonylcarbamoyladenosine modification protein TsaB